MKKYLVLGLLAGTAIPASAADVIYEEPMVTPVVALAVPSWTGFCLLYTSPSPRD